MSDITSDLNQSLRQQIQSNIPFKDLPLDLSNQLLDAAVYRSFPIGTRLLRPDELPAEIHLVIKGEVRMLASHLGDVITLSKRGSGQFLGWSSLLRGKPCEWIQACTETVVISIPSDLFVYSCINHAKFLSYFANRVSVNEAHDVSLSSLNLYPRLESGWSNQIIEKIKAAVVWTVSPGESFIAPDHLRGKYEWFLSTSGLKDIPVGTLITNGHIFPSSSSYLLPYRLVGLPVDSFDPKDEQILPLKHELIESVETRSTNLEALGIVEEDNLKDSERFPIIRGKGQYDEAMAVVEMIALYHRVPFRRDGIGKLLEAQFRRDKKLSIELIGSICELMGLRSHLAEVNSLYFDAIEAPAVIMLEDIPVVYFGSRRGEAIFGHPHYGLKKMDLSSVRVVLGEKFQLLTPRRVGSSPTSRFGWSWFTPSLGKYKNALIIVFIASLLSQLFGLAIPLMIQQIIDKVLSQGNLSSLNVLGTVMVVMALFQGLLTVLRTYIFVDTTDRIDLTLGSAVIDRLLSLPLSFFEKRPVGELSQRLGELNQIRSFLTGTALVSVLNLIFALLYLAVMLFYSPLLTGVALSILPLYLILVFVVAPIYRNLIRKRAIAQARTQSHLIEVLGGIQTVKAQHFEVTARWKWQDRYRHFVDEGFKSTALGAASGEIGKFLNQLSGLLILWVGMWMILDGKFTLGQLIAFRIIAGNVTGPLLQLSGLYQGFQKVQLSMERLSDIVDQNAEFGASDGDGQISLPLIQGSVRFEEVCFRFSQSGPYQVDRVSMEIGCGNFVGIVGQSGSGKSTLMKLLPRLYNVETGRIFIDNYDVTKVDLSSLRRQIGIVPQDSLLFEGTVSENIALNDPQSSTESIIDAAKKACAHDFIMTLPDGYGTKIAERGSNLSGGQRQRIAIARTILSNPQMLIMDEATSALDFDTERQLCSNLQEWANGRTVFFITHRLSTIMNSDIIMVMHNGRLVESGNHKQLLEMGGRYSTLYNQQESSLV